MTKDGDFVNKSLLEDRLFEERMNNIILFNGSLKELNSIDTNKQYIISKPEFSFSVIKYNDSATYKNSIKLLQQELLKNYDGLIRLQIASGFSLVPHSSSCLESYIFTGVPVKLKEEPMIHPRNDGLGGRDF